MKCAIGFVLMFALVALAGCSGSDQEKPRAIMQSTGEAINIYKPVEGDLACTDGIVYLRIWKEFTAKINKETLLPERCD